MAKSKDIAGFGRHENVHRPDDTETLKYLLEKNGELLISGIGPDVAPAYVKRVKAIVRAARGDLRKLKVYYDSSSKIVKAVNESA